MNSDEFQSELERTVASYFEDFIALAECFLNVVGHDFASIAKGIIADWNTGAFTYDISSLHDDRMAMLRVLTAISYLIGNPRCDATGKHYAQFEVTDDKKLDPLLFNPYGVVPFHTDGTFFSGLTEWLMLLKTKEECATRGETILMHLADWDDYHSFLENPLAKHEFTFRGPGSSDTRRASLGDRGDMGEVLRPLFFEAYGHPAFRFTYQYVFPKDFCEARFLKDISTSLASQEQQWAFPLQVGEGYVINNLFWLHGRLDFDQSSYIYREVHRIIGTFR